MEIKYFVNTNNRKRYYFIDILKCLAVMLIVNSHMESSYGKYAFLASGGSIGLALFFFCSGLTINLSGNFFEFYKKRIQRIYPTVFAVALAESIILGKASILWRVLLFGGGWFVSCIMVMYIAHYVIGKYFHKHVGKIIFIYLFMVLMLPLFVNAENSNFYYNGASNYWARFQYFIYLLLGYITRLNIDKLSSVDVKRKWLMILSLSFPCLFYVILMFSNKYPLLLNYSILGVFPLVGTVLSWAFLTASFNMDFNFWSKSLFRCMQFLSALSLEAYLCQFWIISDKWNYLFPLNILLILVIILFVSYLLKIFGNIFMQIFSDRSFDYKKIIKII